VAPAAVHRGAHLTHNGVEPAEDRFADEKMADIELDNFEQRSDFFRGDEIEAMAGMNFKALARRKRGAFYDALEFTLCRRGIASRQSIAPSAGVKLNDRSADRNGGFDLRWLGGNEQRHTNSCSSKFADGSMQALTLAGGIEAAFGGAFLPSLGDKTGGVGAHLSRDHHHLGRRRHFKIERFGDALLQPSDIVIDNVPAILAQMRGNAVGAGRNRDFRGLDGVGMTPAPRVPHGGDVVDVDAKTNGWMHSHEIVRPAVAA
jgi:hypothetical protein